MVSSKWNKILSVLVGLYLVACLSSMAGMELFGWLLFAAVLIWCGLNRESAKFALGEIRMHAPWKLVFAFVIFVFVSVFMNTPPPGENLKGTLGPMRQFLLLFSTTLALLLILKTKTFFRIVCALAIIIGIYALFQTFTGLDLVRGSKALHAVFGNDSNQPVAWRAAGFYGSPLSFAYIMGMHVCVLGSLAFFLPNRNDRMLAAIASAFLLTAVIVSYTRGAWIGIIVAVAIMTLIISRKLFAKAIGAGLVVFVCGLTFSQVVRDRFLTLFDVHMSSNSDRIKLWIANWEMFKESPIFGVGYSWNENLAPQYLAKVGFPGAFAGHAHNNLFQVLAGTGLLGFGAYLLLIGAFMLLSFRVYKGAQASGKKLLQAIGLGTLGAQIFLQVGGLTECNFKDGETNHNLLLLWALTIVTSVLLSTSSKTLQDEILLRTPQK